MRINESFATQPTTHISSRGQIFMSTTANLDILVGYFKRHMHSKPIISDVADSFSAIWMVKIQGQSLIFLVLRKKGSKTKKRMKEEEIEKGDCGPPTRKVFFF